MAINFNSKMDAYSAMTIIAGLFCLYLSFFKVHEWLVPAFMILGFIFIITGGSWIMKRELQDKEMKDIKIEIEKEKLKALRKANREQRK
jgi:hypothetical protein